MRLVLFSLSMMCAAPAIWAQQDSRLLIRVVYLGGEAHADGEYTINGHTRRFASGKEEVVPCGEQSLTVLGTERIKLAISSGFQVRTVGISASPVEAFGQSVTRTPVELENYEDFRQCDRLRIAPVFRPEAIVETKVSVRGRTTILTPEPGTYSFVLIGEHGICGSAFSWASGLRPLRIRIASISLQNSPK